MWRKDGFILYLGYYDENMVTGGARAQGDGVKGVEGGLITAVMPHIQYELKAM